MSRRSIEAKTKPFNPAKTAVGYSNRSGYGSTTDEAPGSEPLDMEEYIDVNI